MLHDQSRYYEMPAAFHTRPSNFSISVACSPTHLDVPDKAQVAYDGDIPVDSFYRAQQVPNAPAVHDSARVLPTFYGQLDMDFGHDSATHPQCNIPADTAELAVFGDHNVAVSLPKQQLAPAATVVPATDEAQALSSGGVINVTALQNKTKNDRKPAPPPVDHDSLAALVSSRERDVKRLLATLATPLANWNAKFIWHCIMKLQGPCE